MGNKKYDNANNAYYQALADHKRAKKGDYKDSEPSAGITKAIDDMIGSVDSVSDAGNVAAIARKHGHAVDAARDKENVLKDEPGLLEKVKSYF